MSQTHAGKVAVVTGAARGLGQEVALCLSRRGATIVVIDLLDTTETEGMIKGAGGGFLGLKADLTVEDDVRQAHEMVTAQFGGADILVNVAGILPTCTFDDTNYALFKRIMTVNVDSIFLACKAFVPDMRARKWGRIINFGSGIVDTSAPDHFAYRTSKAAVLGLGRSLSIDVAADGITVNTVSPSMVITPATLVSGAAETEPFITQMQVIKRAARPRDIVGLVSFLASDDAEFVTGQMIHADGGLVFK